MSKPRSNRAAIAAFCIALLVSGAAAAQERRAFGGLAGLRAQNSASVTQNGSGNGAAIVQTGQGNLADLRQYGRNNTGAIAQTGNNNTACLIQMGRGLDGAIAQSGDHQSMGVVQTHRGARAVSPDVCSRDGGVALFAILRAGGG